MRRMLDIALAVVLAETMLLPPAAFANPQGGVVQGGAATIAGQGTGQVTINQTSQNAVLSWQQFNIQPGEVTQFNQPNANSVALNRILDGNASQILGSLNANGQVFLINPNGILFGQNAVVNVNALTAATSLNAGQLVALSNGFDASAQSAAGARIENQGRIQAGNGGFVYLVAPHVENGESGVIVAPGGDVTLAAGATVYLTDRPDGLGVAIEYTAPGEPGGEAVNLGHLVADAGLVKMRAALVRQQGAIEANAVRETNGRIELYADSELRLDAGSALTARGAEDGSSAGGVISAGTGGNLAIAGTQTIDGASSAKLYAANRVELENGAAVSLANPEGPSSLAIHSGGDVVFGAGARISEAAAAGGTGPASDRWNAQVVAGATDLTATGLDSGTKNDPNAGGVYLSGGTGTTGALQRGSNDGEVALSQGDLKVRAAGDVWVGNGGGLKNRRGAIDVVAGRDVRFTAGSKTSDGVIENGAGDIRVVAGRTVDLWGGQGVDGNAAIRTRGIEDTSDPNRVTRNGGGDILVHAIGGDVDAGVGNRWLTPGPASSTNPNADPLPIVKAGILGIGSEAGGHVTVIAGGDVRTDSAVRQRTGGSAFNSVNQNGDYTGSHIGVFGQDVVDVRSGNTVTTELLPDAPESNLLVIAGGDIRGDYMVRNGRAVFRAGYALKGVDTGTLDADIAANLAVAPNAAGAQIERSLLARTNPARGWFGPLASPVTVDILKGRPVVDESDPARVRVLKPTVDALAANGIAVRAIETPSLVYPAGGQIRTRRVSGYSKHDSAWLEAESGDVVLVGNDVSLPVTEPATPNSPLTFAENPLVRLLPPSLRVTTHRWCPSCPIQRGREDRGGDLVLLNDFTIFPSAHGGLTLNLAGKARTANFAGVGPTNLGLEARTRGAAADQSFTLPSGTVLIDPETGLTFNLQGNLLFDVRRPAQAAAGLALFRASADASDQTIVIPDGTQFTDSRGVVYTTLGLATIPPPQERLSEGQVTFVAASDRTGPVGIAAGTLLVSSDGTVFQTRQQVVIEAWQTKVIADVVAVPTSAGRDVAAGDLRLANPVAGIGATFNVHATQRPAQVAVAVVAANVGPEGNQTPFKLRSVDGPIAGLDPVFTIGPITGGEAASPFGVPALEGGLATVVSTRNGPVGRLAAGKLLRIADPSVLPEGVSTSDIELRAQIVGDDFTLRPTVYQSLQIQRNASGEIVSTSVDPTAGTLASSTVNTWTRDSVTKTATLRQSDASPDFDTRGIPRFTATQFASYYQDCRSGVTCTLTDSFGQPITLGTGATHAGDRSAAQLVAQGGFDRIRIDLAEAADLRTEGDLRDLALLTQHTDASDQTRVYVPHGNARFGAGSLQIRDRDPVSGVETIVDVPDQAATGVQVSGPGTAQVLIGVISHAEADLNHDGFVDRSEYPGTSADFDRIDRDELVPGSGVNDQKLSVREAPWIPTGQGGALTLHALNAEGAVLGLQTVGELQNEVLPTGGAKLDVVSAGDLRLGSRGFIGTLQGGDLRVSSVTGSIQGGTPPPDTTTKRGIVTTFTEAGTAQRPASATGGGKIDVDSLLDFDIGGLALAALSGSSIKIESIDGSVSAGVGEPFSVPLIGFDNELKEVTVSYRGAGIAAPGGEVELVAKEDINIGAGITGAGIVVKAGGNVNAGSGSLSSTGSISISAGQNISGNIQASGSVTISGGSVQAGSNISSSGGLVTGAGSVASNTGSTRTSTETTRASQESEAAAFGTGTGVGSGAERKRVVMIDVTSRPCDDDECRS